MINILTFNSHQPYNYNFAKIGARIFVVHKIPGKNIKHWDTNIRPCPQNVVLISLDEGEALYRRKQIDLAVCHNISDVMEIRDWRIKKVLCVHETVRGRIVTEQSRIDRREWNQMVKSYLRTAKDVHLVFVSEKKAKDWDLEGYIIEPGVDSDDYYGHKGKIPEALTVSNQFKVRGEILGYVVHGAILSQHPCEIVGYNPGLPDSKPAKNWDELKRKYQQYRVYLFTAQEEYEDGYNLAMLEAMVTGMPIISYKNDTSPVKDGVQGYISDDIYYLRERMEYLLENREAAIELGRAARKTAVEKFGISQYIEEWKKLISDII